MGYEENSLKLFRYAERADEIKRQAMERWPEIPIDTMGVFAGELLASGVVLWALINNTGLDAMRWPGDLPVVLGLKVKTGSTVNIGQVLQQLADKAGLLGAEIDQLKATFLEMLQWLVVDQLHTSLFADQRAKLATLLKETNFPATDRAQTLDKLSTFMQNAGIIAMDAQSFFERSLRECIDEAERAISG